MKFVMIMALLTLVGCGNSSTERHYPAMPPELADCRVFELNNTSGEKIVVTRCPSSSTSTNYKAGKTTATTVVIDGVEYVRDANFQQSR